MSDISNRNIRINSICAMLAIVVFLLIHLTGMSSFLRNQSYDVLFYLRGDVPPPEEVLIIAIDEPSFGNIGLQWPWPRSLHAALIENLTAAGARTIALDIIFAENSTTQSDLLLKNAIANHGNVVMASDIQVINEENFQQIVRVLPVESLVSDETSTGFVVLPLDFDGILRAVNASDDVQFSFSYLAAQKYLDAQCCASVQQVEEVSSRINYYGPARHINTVSYYQALDFENSLPENIFRDKLVFVGLSVQTMVDSDNQSSDYYLVPTSRFNGGLVAGVEIQATAAANYLANNFIQATGEFWVISIVILFSIILLVLVIKTKPLLALLAYIGVSIFVVFISVIFFSEQQIFMPISDIIVSPTIVFFWGFVSQFYIHFSDKKFVRRLFSAYVAPEILKKLENDISALELGGTEVSATILFMDIEGYTALSENMKPTELIDKLNIVLGRVADAIIKHEGMVNNYIGDAVMGIWGPPLDTQNHADLACKTALEIFEIIHIANEDLKLGSPINVRIGINTGNVVSGNVGSEKAMKFTVMGDPVNLASRLEGINNFYNTRIIISKETVDHLQQPFKLRELDDIRVKGKENAVGIFELGNTSLSDDMVKLYHQAKTAYQSGQWLDAITMLQEILAEVPQDGPSKVLLARCREYVDSPPDSTWQGVHIFTEK